MAWFTQKDSLSCCERLHGDGWDGPMMPSKRAARLGFWIG
uniref:Uncharacterized protein n=1 Tax=Arundo donax TaxID=35708 RepID=A0A0A9HER5_ARUDO